MDKTEIAKEKERKRPRGEREEERGSREKREK